MRTLSTISRTLNHVPDHLGGLRLLTIFMAILVYCSVDAATSNVECLEGHNPVIIGPRCRHVEMDIVTTSKRLEISFDTKGDEIYKLKDLKLSWYIGGYKQQCTLKYYTRVWNAPYAFWWICKRNGKDDAFYKSLYISLTPSAVTFNGYNKTESYGGLETFFDPLGDDKYKLRISFIFDRTDLELRVTFKETYLFVEGMSTVQIAMIVLGSVCVVLAIIGIVVSICYCKGDKKDESKKEKDVEEKKEEPKKKAEPKKKKKKEEKAGDLVFVEKTENNESVMGESAVA